MICSSATAGCGSARGSLSPRARILLGLFSRTEVGRRCRPCRTKVPFTSDEGRTNVQCVADRCGVRYGCRRRTTPVVRNPHDPRVVIMQSRQVRGAVVSAKPSGLRGRQVRKAVRSAGRQVRSRCRSAGPLRSAKPSGSPAQWAPAPGAAKTDRSGKTRSRSTNEARVKQPARPAPVGSPKKPESRRLKHEAPHQLNPAPVLTGASLRSA